MVVARRPTERENCSPNPQNYIPCEFCLAFIRFDCIESHVSRCSNKPITKQPEANYLRNGCAMLAPFLIDERSNEDKEVDELIENMKETAKNPGLIQICREDTLLREFAQSLLCRLGTIDEQRRKDKDNIRTKVRSVARLIVKLNEYENEENHPLSFFISPGQFRRTLLGVKMLCLESDSPNIAITLGNYLKQIFLIKISLAIEKGDEEMKKEGEEFERLYQTHWNNQVSAVANRRKRLRAINKTVPMPDTGDIMKLRDYLMKEITDAVKNESPTKEEWLDLCAKLMVRIVTFNVRRVSEVEELKKDDFSSRPKDIKNDQIMQSLALTERALYKR